MPSEGTSRLFCLRALARSSLRAAPVRRGRCGADGYAVNSEAAFVAVVAIAAITLCWVSYLAFCLVLARKDSRWSVGAAEIAKAFWRNVGRGIKSGSYDPRGLPEKDTPPHDATEWDDSSG